MMQPIKLMRFFRYRLFFITLIVGLLSCRTASPVQNSRLVDAVDDQRTSNTPRTCAAIRGNGQRIFAHFAALARISEHYGLLEAISGGSSASVTTFIYDSMLQNPALNRCNGGPCTPEEVGGRMALLLKSIDGYLEVLANTPEAVALRGLVALRPLIEQQGISSLLAENRLEEATQHLQQLFNSRQLLELINPKIFEQLADGKVREVVEQIQGLGDFEITDQTLFFREGLFNFKAFAKIIGRVGDFYAGRNLENVADLTSFLDVCTEPARGRLWAELKTVDNGICAAKFQDLLSSYRSTMQSHVASPRINDRVGSNLPTLISTSILSGVAAQERFLEAKRRYDQGEEPNFQVDFDTMVKVGYFGSKPDLARVLSNPMKYSDLRTSKLIGLIDPATDNAYSWETALSLSPAEPGLANIQALTATQASMGGWADLHPVQVLENLGCETVIYITRQEVGADFAVDVSKQLNATSEDMRNLYGMHREGRLSSNMQAWLAADGAWCTDWNSFAVPGQIQELWADGYNAPLITENQNLIEPLNGFLPNANVRREAVPGHCVP